MPGNFNEVPESVVEGWPAPDYNTKDRRSWLPAFSCTLLGLATVLTAARLYLRTRKQAGEFGLDDVFIFLGWLASVGLTVCAVIDSEWYGLDVHTWDVNPETQYVGAAFTGWVAQVIFLFSTNATKISVLLFYRRMVKGINNSRWRYAVWAALGFTGATFVTVLLCYCLVCRPLDAYWLSYDFDYEKEYTCIDGNVLSPFVGVLSMISDIYTVALPCVMLQHFELSIPRRQKIGLNIVFALGMIVAGCGIARTYYLWKINHTYDTSWVGFDLFVWSLLECHLAIIFACAPSLRAFLRRFLGESFGSRFGSGSFNRSQTGAKASSRQTSAFQDKNKLGVELKQVDAFVDRKESARVDEESIQESNVAWPLGPTSTDMVPGVRVIGRREYQHGDVSGQQLRHFGNLQGNRGTETAV